MRIFLSIVFFFSLVISVFGQQDHPDSGFTNKAEAENLMVNRQKEGKWLEYVDYKDSISTIDKVPFYRLAVYKNGKLYGIARKYWHDCNKLYIEAWYCCDGRLKKEIRYKDGGDREKEVKKFYRNGKVQSDTYYEFNNPIVTKTYHENSNEIK